MEMMMMAPLSPPMNKKIDEAVVTKDEVRPSSLADTSDGSSSDGSNQNSPRDTSALPLTRTFSMPAAAHLNANAPFTRTASAPATVKMVDDEPLPEDPIAKEFDIVLNERLPMSLSFVLETLWRQDKFTIDGLRKSNETDIAVTPWSDRPVDYTAFTRPETFQAERRVTFTHNKKNFIGPSSIPTTQIHRYTYHEGKRLVVSVTSSVHDAPFCDYFRAESRWVFNAHDGECVLTSGLRLNWTKSTFLKGQIEGFAKSESKTVMQKWLQQAMDAYNASKPPGSAPSTLPAAPALPLAVQPSAGLSPESSLTFLRKANIVCLVLVLLTLVQFVTTLHSLRSTTLETARLQRQQLALLQQLAGQLQCPKP
ncbi:Aste57867_18678 [Aphanomyces stellatus]|uniref:Aste57867_18678 protein n=1 Tax=Aphanomyces stellatus TaxID=120398 RepID=A0A485LCF2_9STRA|nr:hypothetical protein As57867_018616 [Aphanomyces stellatus]VFT95413.1 Aste57867_18678 [Aphanomyces stellatus]